MYGLTVYLLETVTAHLGGSVTVWALEVVIMMAPSKAPVVAGTGGLRKLRFVEEGSNRGTSGGLRVCYAYFPDHNTVLMVIAFDKH